MSVTSPTFIGAEVVEPDAEPGASFFEQAIESARNATRTGYATREAVIGTDLPNRGRRTRCHFPAILLWRSTGEALRPDQGQAGRQTAPAPRHPGLHFRLHRWVHPRLSDGGDVHGGLLPRPGPGRAERLDERDARVRRRARSL